MFKIILAAALLAPVGAAAQGSREVVAAMESALLAANKAGYISGAAAHCDFKIANNYAVALVKFFLAVEDTSEPLLLLAENAYDKGVGAFRLQAFDYGLSDTCLIASELYSYAYEVK
jgi:hypothetical protein